MNVWEKERFNQNKRVYKKMIIYNYNIVTGLPKYVGEELQLKYITHLKIHENID